VVPPGDSLRCSFGPSVENTKTTCFASVRFFIPLRLQKQAFDAFRNKKTHSKEWVFVL